MKKVINVSMFALVSMFSLSSLAGITDSIGDFIADNLFVDDQATLYCEMKCADYKPIGAYIKEVDGTYYKVMGSWVRMSAEGGLSYENQKQRVYITNQKQMNAIVEACNAQLGNMIDGNKELAKKIKFGFIEESQCAVKPVVTVATGQNSYQVMVPGQKTEL